MPLGPAEVEIGLVQRCHHDGGGEVLEHGSDRMGRLAIVRERALEECGLGTEANRLGDRHARVNAEAARRMGGRLNHPSLVSSPAHHQ
jgi:hypothetical protein